MGETNQPLLTNTIPGGAASPMISGLVRIQGDLAQGRGQENEITAFQSHWIVKRLQIQN